jgi:hypothetical protein
VITAERVSLDLHTAGPKDISAPPQRNDSLDEILNRIVVESMIADELLNDGDDDIFVYMGGEQEVPRDVRRAKIDESIDTIPRYAFMDCRQLIEVEGHDRLKKIEYSALLRCRSLRRLKRMNGVIKIGAWAFAGCNALSDLEFDKAEIIGASAFAFCKSLKFINLPYIRRVRRCAFMGCEQLTGAKFSEELERIGKFSSAFYGCDNFSRIDIVGGIHKTISSLHLERWRDEMRKEFESINQTLPEIPASEKTKAIGEWIRSVIVKMEHYKAEHQILVKKAMTLLELALWKAKLQENESNIDIGSELRKQHKVTCGANIVIKNVLPFLVLK